MNLHKALQSNAVRKRWYAGGIALLVVLFLGQWIARRLEVIEQTHGRLSYLSAARESLSDKTQVVFIGSSHLVGGIRPDSFSVESMNIAGTGFDYFVLEKILRKHLGSMPNLELAVIELDPVPLVIDAVKIRKGDYRAFYVWGLGHNEIPHGANAIVKRISHAVSHIFVPDFRLTPRTVSTTLDQISSSSEKREMSPGFLGSDRVLRPGGGSPEKRIAALSRNANDDNIKRNQQALRRMVELLLERDVRVVFVALPHRASYSSIVPRLWRQELRKTQKEIETSFRRGIPFWDFEQSPAFRTMHFMDTAHLNSSGARLLSTLLDQKVKDYLELHSSDGTNRSAELKNKREK